MKEDGVKRFVQFQIFILKSFVILAGMLNLL